MSIHEGYKETTIDHLGDSTDVASMLTKVYPDKTNIVLGFTDKPIEDLYVKIDKIGQGLFNLLIKHDTIYNEAAEKKIRQLCKEEGIDPDDTKADDARKRLFVNFAHTVKKMLSEEMDTRMLMTRSRNGRAFKAGLQIGTGEVATDREDDEKVSFFKKLFSGKKGKSEEEYDDE